ncbi:Oidioi.mRNA.OKI2018_I69.XSR.g16993.t1.cds [Oikopleura dioica]|uniref:Oidioi.mRNA.OKI2018_I69.XSR.g16993.t1.cds n=1 Tax=Oikopleura dioica TaxID=34765 RepID=A0ABN7SQ45_OIKDI|nr:Oidioi.mRNA.OKI2018_I69.XSR.g16993.t1.cds [Oikopleura dioica]
MRLFNSILLAAAFAQEESCFDKIDNCQSLKEQGRCSVLNIKTVQCRRTCGDCPNGADYSDRCYRDSPCNEKGTVGGNAEGCSSIDRAPFFKCKCKKYFSGTNCATFNCPCKNGGQCAQCYADECQTTPSCICKDPFQGKFCEKRIAEKKAPYYGPWSNWDKASCDGFTGQTRTRYRYCTDGTKQRSPTCCKRGSIKNKFCRMEYDGEPVTETQKCGSGPFWSEWSAWNRACVAENGGRNIWRNRKCIGGRAYVDEGCRDRNPGRRQTKRCPTPRKVGLN